MRRERTDYERLSDNAVLLSLWSLTQDVNGSEAVGDRLKMMKLAFLAAYPLYWDRVKALNLSFYRYTRGPFTEQVSDSFDDLWSRQFLGEDELFYVTDEGARLATSFTTDVLGLEQNRHILYKIQEVVTTYGSLDTQSLLDKVYGMYCYTLGSPRKKRRVKAVQQRQEFTGLLEPGEADDGLYIPPGWQVTLELAFDPNALRNLQRGVEDSCAGRVYGWSELGADV